MKPPSTNPEAGGPRSPRARTLLIRASVAIAVLAPFWFWRGGILELEVLQFIPQYLDDRGLLQKIFHPYANDFRTYQARELSYFFDYIDAQVFRRLMAADIVSFIPLSAVVASAMSAVVFLRSVRRLTAIPPTVSALLLLLYLTNYVHVVTMGMFYRSTKPLLAPVLMAAVFYVAARLGDPAHDRRWQKAAVVFGLFTLMGLLDRQGYFYAAAGFALLGGATLVSRAHWPLAAGAAAAVLVTTAYSSWIGPAIVHAVNGYVPTLEYQSVAGAALTSGLEPYRRGSELLATGTSLMMGGMPAWAAVALVAIVLGAGAFQSRLRVHAVAALAAIAFAHLAMFAIMVVRLPPVYEWIDHRYWYYPLPFQALLIALVALALGRLLVDRGPWAARAVAAAIAILIVANVAQWERHRDVMLGSRWFSRVYPQTRMLKGSLKAGRPDPGLILQYRQFYEFCLTLSPGLRERTLYPEKE